ncbi:MAG: hypothetical protein WCB94_13875 [Terriglobales bacterium]
MKRSYIGLALGALVTVAALLIFPSCGFNKRLVSLTITPQTHEFLLPTKGQTEQLTATATYIHPPSTEDVTTKATWSVDDGVVGVSAGTITTNGNFCGGANITATMPVGTGGSSNIVSAYATIIVDDPSSNLCPGGGKFAYLVVGIEGNGTVTSSPPGISCPAACQVTNVAVNSSVLLTAVPANGLTTTWGNCTTFTGNLCTVTVPTGGTVVTATFAP